MSKKNKTEAKAVEAKPAKTAKAKVADLPAIDGLHKFNPCRVTSTGRDGVRRPSERLFLADEMLKAKNTPYSEIQTNAATRWAAAARKAGNTSSTEDLVKLYKAQIPVNDSTIKYMDGVLPAAVAKKFETTVSFKSEGGNLTASIKA